MAFLILLNTRFFTAGADLTTRNNKLEIHAEAEVKPSTNFGSGGWTEVKGGLFDTTIDGEGQWEAGDSGKVDDAAFAALGGVGAWSACPDTADLGALAWFSQALTGKYQLGGAVGDVAPWSLGMKGAWPLVRGQVAHPPGTARTATGTGTGVELGAVSATQKLYASAHVLSVAGTDTPTITLAIESDEDNTFATAVDRITFDAATARGGQIKRVDGAITDTWFRPKWTISGTNPSFLFLIAFGIK